MAASGDSISTKERFWRAHMARQAGSGLSIARYCEQHGLALSTFHVWRRRLAASARLAERRGVRAAGPTRETLFKELRVEEGEAFPVAEAERARQTGDAQRAGVELILSRPLRLRLSPGFDEESARRALRLAREMGEC